MSDVFGKIKSGAGKIANKADKAVDIKRIEMQIGPIKKEIEGQYLKLGQITYDSNVKKVENPESAGIIAKITELKQQIVAKEEEIMKIREDKVVSQAAAPTAPGKKFCTNCGRENDASSNFCFNCGAKMG